VPWSTSAALVTADDSFASLILHHVSSIRIASEFTLHKNQKMSAVEVPGGIVSYEDSARSQTRHASQSESHQQSAPVESVLSLTRKTGFFHAFISYQVVADSSRAESLYSQLVSLSSQNFTQVPAAESFYWPKEFNRSSRSCSCPVRIFYDKECLAEGQVWDWNTNIDSPANRVGGGGFLGALFKSIVIVPLVSVRVDNSGKLEGSLGRLFRYGYKSFALGESNDPLPSKEFKKDDDIWFSSQSAWKHLLLFTRYKVTDVQPHDGSITAKAEDHHSVEFSNARVKFSDDRLKLSTDVEYGSMKGLCVYRTTDNEKTEGVDNVLFEWMFAFALHKANLNRPSTQHQALSSCRSLFPIFLGGIHSDSPLSSINSKVLHLLSENAPQKILDKIRSAFLDVGLLHRYNFLDVQTFGLKHFVSELLKFQGFDYQSTAEKTDSVDYPQSVCRKIFSCISMSTIDPGKYTADKPMMLELFGFLERSKSKYMIPALTNHNICSVADLGALDAQPNSDLVNEISQSSRKSPKEVTLHLLKLIRRAQSSFLSQPLDERLKKFKDDKLSLFTAATSKSALDLLLGKPFFQFVILLFFAAGTYSAVISYSRYEWEGNTISTVCLAIGCGAAGPVSYFWHPRYGRYTLAVMFIALIGATIYGWYSSRDGGFGYCEIAQATNNLNTDFETCDNYFFFVIVFVQLIEFSGCLAFSLIWQQYFWLYLFLINTILNVCWYIADRIIIRSKPTDKIQDLTYAGVMFFVFCFLLVSRQKLRLKALFSGEKAAEEYRKSWKTICLMQKEHLDSLKKSIENFKNFKDVMDSTHKPLPPLLQNTSNLQELYDRGQFMNYTFQEWVQSWFKSNDIQFADPQFASRFKVDLSAISKNVEVIRGPIKQPSRAISKIYRTYGGKVERLTDVVRCTVLCKNISDILEISKAVLDKGCATAKPDNCARCTKVFQQLWAFFSANHISSFTEQNADQAAVFEISRIRNRFDESWRAADGYRDLSFKLLVAAEESDCGGCWFVPVERWPKKREGEFMICELQLKLKGEWTEQDAEQMHDTYVQQRDLLSQ
jgi:hypothetical protein